MVWFESGLRTEEGVWDSNPAAGAAGRQSRRPGRLQSSVLTDSEREHDQQQRANARHAGGRSLDWGGHTVSRVELGLETSGWMLTPCLADPMHPRQAAAGRVEESLIGRPELTSLSFGHCCVRAVVDRSLVEKRCQLVSSPNEIGVAGPDNYSIEQCLEAGSSSLSRDAAAAGVDPESRRGLQGEQCRRQPLHRALLPMDKHRVAGIGLVLIDDQRHSQAGVYDDGSGHCSATRCSRASRIICAALSPGLRP